MYEEYDKIIKERLDKKRYIHSVNVAKKAAELSVRFGGDSERAYLAGLLHDICKNETYENTLKLFDEFGIILDNVSENAPKLWHAIAGSAYVERVLGIKDEQIISAIRYHTTGRADMTLLEKIVFLADFVSDERDFDGVDEIRKSIEQGLDYAIYFSLRFTILDLCENSLAVHPDSFRAYNQAVISIRQGKV